MSLNAFQARWVFLVRFGLFVLLLGGCCVPFAIADPGYYTLDTDKSQFQGPLNHGQLNHPLTAADRLVVQQGHFFKVGPDGQAGTADDQRVRLYGVNLTYSANFPTRERAKFEARRLRFLGFNAVRLHHMDSQPDATSATTNSLLLQGPFPSFNPKSVAALKVFLDALKAEGIYANLNLYVGYRFSPQIDQLAPLAGAETTLPPGSPAQIFYPRLRELQATYARELIRQLDLKDDPVLAMVEIRNESSLVSAWQAWDSQQWTNAIQGDYALELTKQWNAWLVQTYGTLPEACAHWKSCSGNEPQALVSPTEADELRTGQKSGYLGKVIDRLFVLWGKLKAWLGWVAADEAPAIKSLRLYDFARFLTDADQRYFDELQRVVRSAARPSVPVTGTQMGFGGDANRLSQKNMDYVDDHFYIDHYDFPKVPWDAHDWRIKDNALSATEIQALADLSQRRDRRRPFVVSEYNQAFPNRQGSGLMPVMALLGALEDWDGLFQFDYADGDQWGTLPSGFRLSGDWSKLAVTGQSAHIFRSGLLTPHAAPSALEVNTTRVLDAVSQRQREGRGVPTASKALPKRQLFGSSADASPNASPNAAPPSSVRYVNEEGRLVFDAPRVAGFVGSYAPGQRISIANMDFAPATGRGGFATLVVTPLDDLPMPQSKHLLLSVPGHVMGSQPGAMPARPKQLVPYASSREWWTLEPDLPGSSQLSGSREAVGPVWMARVPLQFTWHRTANGIQVYPLSLTGQRLEPLPTVKVPQGFEVKLQMESAPQSPWYEVVVDPVP